MNAVVNTAPYYGQPLTNHEIEILSAIAHGHADRQIAGRFYISESTVKTHLRRMTIKLGSKNRANMVAIGFAKGYLRLPRSVLKSILEEVQ